MASDSFSHTTPRLIFMITVHSLNQAAQHEVRLRRIERAERVVTHLRRLESNKLPTQTLSRLERAAAELRKFGQRPQNSFFRNI